VTGRPGTASAGGAIPVRGFVIVIISASLFGMLGPLSRFAYDAGMQPPAFVAWRAAFGFLALATFVGWRVRHGTTRLIRFSPEMSTTEFIIITSRIEQIDCRQRQCLMVKLFRPGG